MGTLEQVRRNLGRTWESLAEGWQGLRERAGQEVRRLLDTYEPSALPDAVKADLAQRMAAEANRWGMERLPHERL